MWRRDGLRGLALAAWRRVERAFDGAFGSAANPLRQLGALAFACLGLLGASGIVLYTALDTSATGAYRSIVDLWPSLPGLGSLLRSLHRYAADAFVITMALHGLREWLHGHERGVRRYSWLTGVPPIVLAFAAAIGGFWLHWDRLGQYSAIATAEWLNALPWLATPLARNFIAVDAVSDRLFSLFVFVHIGVPLLLLFAFWFHIQRLTRAAVWPPRRLGLGLLGTLLALAWLAPVTSHAPADLATVPQAVRLDWVLLFIHPLADALSPALAWAVVAGGLLLLLALPFMPQPPREAVAVVDTANCNGCRRCFADCPFAAITMLPHPNQKVGKQLAQVDADLCAGCGICVGACPSSTPFRSAVDLVTGIDMPQSPIGALRTRLQRGIAALRGEPKIIAFGCDRGARIDALAAPDVATFSLLCAGQLPPSFVEYALRDGAAGVLVAACREGGCEYRLGERWTDQRLRGAREPYLRENVPRERVALAWAGSGDEAALRQALDGLRGRIGGLRHA